MKDFYEKLNIPASCIVENTVFKKIFFDKADLLKADKKIINEHIKKIVWKYCLKPDNTNIPVYKDEEREYYEIEIIEVQLNETAKVKRIAEIIMRSIPYPILLVFVKDDKIQLAAGNMRKNLSGNSKVTVEEFTFTDWFEPDSLNMFTKKLSEDLNYKNLNCTDFYQLYKDINNRLNLYNISKFKGKIISNDNSRMSVSDIKECYDKIQLLDTQITKLKSQVKKADSIKNKVELNIQINELRKQKKRLSNKI